MNIVIPRGENGNFISVIYSSKRNISSKQYEIYGKKKYLITMPDLQYEEIFFNITGDGLISSNLFSEEFLNVFNLNKTKNFQNQIYYYSQKYFLNQNQINFNSQNFQNQNNN